MLRNRSRAVTSKQKQPNMAENISPSQNHTRPPISSFFGSPRFFSGFLGNGHSETETTMSPTSILDCKTSPTFANPFGYDRNLSKFSNTTLSEDRRSWESSSDPKGIGVALIDSHGDETAHDDNISKPNKKMVLFGSKLKIQIPPLPSSALSPADSPKSPADFGIKTQNSQFSGSLSPLGSLNSGIQTGDSPKASPIGSLSISEIELSEDYTCVISHGPNPRTTHIYCNCVVENCCGVVKLSELRNDSVSLSDKLNSPSDNFLSFCHTCKKNLEQGQDIYMYRGEEAFCSPECRCREMLFDGVENSDLVDVFGTQSSP
ncbi:FCS-Like Zinc finger 8-like [Cornus florida]|uniref:FCS-Like Zinc finger 8-like n=1 Tax=Cornus florida TaxID=4283 RepID=UPI00289DE43C|nr:FCS-Like Zinc finger 8-like [Cornus florida]